MLILDEFDNYDAFQCDKEFWIQYSSDSHIFSIAMVTKLMGIVGINQTDFSEIQLKLFKLMAIT